MKIKELLKKQKKEIKPEKEVLDKINRVSDRFCGGLKNRLKKKKINADVFIGGSIAKGTLARKKKYDSEGKNPSDSQTFLENVYDVDVFVRFSEEYGNKDLSKLLKKVVKGKKIHGSRDYFQIVKEGVILEVVPVLKIKKPENAKNVTDLSYFHVNYVRKKIKRKKRLADEIRLTKAFMQAQKCYGAESYVKGFSGYAVELLIIHYGSFLKFLKAVAKSRDKIIIDDSKFYKRKNVLRELNESKVKSPIVLIDPTFKERNALAGLSKETFKRFKEVVKMFLKNPSKEFFEEKNVYEEMKKKYRRKLKVVEVKTKKQRGDIAGTKSKKFFNFFIRELKKEFEVVNSGFEYDEKKNMAYFYFVLKKKKQEVIKGPLLKDKKNVERFKRMNKDVFEKGSYVYARIKHNLDFNKWFKRFKRKKTLKEMSIKKVRLIY